MVEKKAISIINQRENKDRLLRMAGQVLEERSLCVTLEDFFLQQNASSGAQGNAAVEDAAERRPELSPALECNSGKTTG